MDTNRPNNTATGETSGKTDESPTQRLISSPTAQVGSSTGTKYKGSDAVKIATKTFKHSGSLALGETSTSSCLTRTVALGNTSTSPRFSGMTSALDEASTGQNRVEHPAIAATSSRPTAPDQPGALMRIDDNFSAAWQLVERKGAASSTSNKNKGQRHQVRLLTDTRATSTGPANWLVPNRQVNFGAGGRRLGDGLNRQEPCVPVTSAEGGPPAIKKSSKRPGKRAFNQTVLPCEDHKRTRFEQSRRGRNKRYGQAANSYLNVAIICERTWRLDQQIADKVLAEIQKKILIEAWSPNQHGPGPAFNGKPVYADGILKLWCSNYHTLAWLQETVSGLALPSSVSLVVKSQSDLFKRTRCAIAIPNEEGVLEETSDIGRVLAYQNPWVHIHRWVLHKAVKQTAEWFVVVGVPEDQIPTLMKAERCLSIGLGAVQVKFQGPNGDFTDVPQGWDPATATIRQELKHKPTRDKSRSPKTPEFSADSDTDVSSAEDLQEITSTGFYQGEDLFESGYLQLEDAEEGATNDDIHL